MFIVVQQIMGIKDCVLKDVCFWYDGFLFFEYFDDMKVLECKINVFFMMVVVGKYCDMGIMIEGKIEVGVVKKGLSVIMMFNKQLVDIVVVYGEMEDEVNFVQCGDQVCFCFCGIEEEEIMFGFVFCLFKCLVYNVVQFEVQICIFDFKSIFIVGFNCVLYVYVVIEEVIFVVLLYKLQKGINRKSKLLLFYVKKGDSIIVCLQVIGGVGLVCVERFEDYFQMGCFILCDQVCF